jgi:glutamine cyclotransferase
MFRFLILVVCGICISCTSSKNDEVPAEDIIPFKLAKVFPHDITAYTQGLTIYNGRLFESTGQEGTSWISEVDIATGKQNKKVILDQKYFGEGITILNNKIYQLTWQHKIGFVYQLPSYAKIKEFNYNYEGWGITDNGQQLIVSDGTDQLHFLDTLNLTETRTVSVKHNGQPMNNLNELEFIDGFVFANQYQTNYILKINPENGEVVGVMDMSTLRDEVLKFEGNPDVLNGIAYEPKSKTLLVTGKLWPVLFVLKIEADVN